MREHLRLCGARRIRAVRRGLLLQRLLVHHPPQCCLHARDRPPLLRRPGVAKRRCDVAALLQRGSDCSGRAQGRIFGGAAALRPLWALISRHLHERRLCVRARVELGLLRSATRAVPAPPWRAAGKPSGGAVRRQDEPRG
jgi:hypothetical protein